MRLIFSFSFNKLAAFFDFDFVVEIYFNASENVRVIFCVSFMLTSRLKTLQFFL